MRIYLDSNVLIAYAVRDFGKITDFMEDAFKNFLAVCLEDKHEIVLSDLFFKEVEKITFSKSKEVMEMINKFGNLRAIQIKTSEEDRIIARKLELETGIHYPDSVHLQLALKLNCDYIITWDKGFEKAKQKINCLTPKDFR